VLGGSAITPGQQVLPIPKALVIPSRVALLNLRLPRRIGEAPKQQHGLGIRVSKRKGSHIPLRTIQHRIFRDGAHPDSFSQGLCAGVLFADNKIGKDCTHEEVYLFRVFDARKGQESLYLPQLNDNIATANLNMDHICHWLWKARRAGVEEAVVSENEIARLPPSWGTTIAANEAHDATDQNSNLHTKASSSSLWNVVWR
jgi:hypothetical protein